MSELCRQMLDALLPPGPLWAPKDGGGLDQLLQGVAECLEPLRADLEALALTRNPQGTGVLPDLEREFGVLTNEGVAESIRRGRLAAIKAGRRGNGSAEFMQAQLRAAGLDVYVHVNDPPVDPALFPGVLIPNGDTWQHSFYGSTTCADGDAVCGYEGAVCAAQAGYNQIPIVLPLPTDLGYWPLIFFVGGPATRWAGGELLTIEDAAPALVRYAELVDLINRYKPLHTWCVLKIDLDVGGAYQYDDGSTVKFDDNIAIQGVQL